jgi:hypothetical protein
MIKKQILKDRKVTVRTNKVNKIKNKLISLINWKKMLKLFVTKHKMTWIRRLPMMIKVKQIRLNKEHHVLLK